MSTKEKINSNMQGQLWWTWNMPSKLEIKESGQLLSLKSKKDIIAKYTQAIKTELDIYIQVDMVIACQFSFSLGNQWQI